MEIVHVILILNLKIILEVLLHSLQALCPPALLEPFNERWQPSAPLQFSSRVVASVKEDKSRKRA